LSMLSPVWILQRLDLQTRSNSRIDPFSDALQKPKGFSVFLTKPYRQFAF
jgi:hypothetical protein